MPVVVRVLLQLEDEEPVQVSEMILSRPEHGPTDLAAALRAMADEIENPTP
jgi:hypothetical protein